VAIPEKKRPTTLEEAVEQLRSDPLHAVRMHVNDVDVEVHPVRGEERKPRWTHLALGTAHRSRRSLALVRERPQPHRAG
jgi:hypothetical protein